VWNQLPVEDAIIATSLGVTRQQVINLRQVRAARGSYAESGMLDESTKSFRDGKIVDQLRRIRL